MQKLPPISGAKGRSKSSMDYQYIKTKVIAQNQIFNKRAIDKMEVAPLYKEYKTDASLTPEDENSQRQQYNPIVLYLQNVYAELGRILLKDESDPLFGDINKENDSQADSKLSREQLEKLFSDDIKLAALNQEENAQSMKNCSVFGELGYNDDHIAQLNELQEEKAPLPLQPTLSDQEVFFQAFDAAIQYLDQTPSNNDAVQALQQIKRYFKYKLETKSSSERARDDALKTLDDQIAGLEKQNSHLLQKIQEQTEIIERLQAYNAQINSSLLASKKALHTYEGQLSNAQAEISQQKKTVTYLEQGIAREKHNFQELQSRFKRQNEQAMRTKEQFEILNGKITALQTRLNAETAEANSLRQERGDLQNALRDATSKIQNLETEIQGLKSQIDGLTKQVHGHQEELAKARLEAQNTQPDSQTLDLAARALRTAAGSRQALRGLAGTGLTEDMLRALDLVISTLESQVSFDRFREILGGIPGNKNQNRATYAKGVQVDMYKALDLSVLKGNLKESKPPGKAEKAQKPSKDEESKTKASEKEKDKVKKNDEKKDQPAEAVGPSALDIIQKDDALPSLAPDNESDDDESQFQGTGILSTGKIDSESFEDNREIIPIDIKSIIPNSQNPSKSTARNRSNGQNRDQDDEQSDSIPTSPDLQKKKPQQISMIPENITDSGVEVGASEQPSQIKSRGKNKKPKDQSKSDDIMKIFGKQTSRYVQVSVVTGVKQTQYESINPIDKTVQTDIIFSPTSSRGPAFDYQSMISQLRDEKIELFNQLQIKQKEVDDLTDKMKKLQVPKPKKSIMDILKQPKKDKKKDQGRKLTRRYSFSDILNIPLFNGEQANMNFLDTQWLQDQNAIMSSRSTSRALSRESKGIYNKEVQVDSYMKQRIDEQKAHQDEIIMLTNQMQDQLKQRDAVIQNLSKNLQQKINMLKVYKEAAEEGDISQQIEEMSNEMAELQQQNEALIKQNSDLQAKLMQNKHEQQEDRQFVMRQKTIQLEQQQDLEKLFSSPEQSLDIQQLEQQRQQSDDQKPDIDEIQPLTEEQLTVLEKSGDDCVDCQNKNDLIMDLQQQIVQLKQQLSALQEQQTVPSPALSTKMTQQLPTCGSIVNVFESALSKSKVYGEGEANGEETHDTESSSDERDDADVLARSQTRLLATMDSLQRLEGKMPYNKENQDLYFQQLLEDVKTMQEQRTQLKQQIDKQQLKFITIVFKTVSDAQQLQNQISEWNAYHETTLKMNNKNTQRSRTEKYNQNIVVLNEQLKRVYDKLQKQQDKLKNTQVFDMALEWQENNINEDPELSQYYARIQALQYKRSEIRQIEQDIDLMKRLKAELQLQVDGTIKVLDSKSQYQASKLQQSSKQVVVQQSQPGTSINQSTNLEPGISNEIMKSQLTSKDLEASFENKSPISNVDQPKQPSILSTSPLSNGGYKIDRSQSLSPRPAKKRTQPNKNYQLLSKNINNSILNRCKHLNELSDAGVFSRVQGVQTEISLIGVTSPESMTQIIKNSSNSIHNSSSPINSVTVSGSFNSSGNYTIKSRQIDHIYKMKKEKDEEKKQQQIRKVLQQQKALILELQAKIDELSTKKVADKQIQVYISTEDSKDAQKAQSKSPSRVNSPRRMQSRKSRHERDMQLFNQLLTEINDIQVGDIDDQLKSQEEGQQVQLLQQKLQLYEQRINSLKASLIVYQNKSQEPERISVDRPVSISTNRSVIISHKAEFRSVSEINKKYSSPSMVTLAQPAFQQFSIDKPIFNNTKAIERFREAQHQMTIKNVIMQKKQNMLNTQIQTNQTRNMIDEMVTIVQSETQIHEKLNPIFDFISHPKIMRHVLAKNHQQGSIAHKIETVLQETNKNVSQDFVVSEFCLVGQEELIRSTIFGFVVQVDQEGNSKETYSPMMLKQLKDPSQYKELIEKQKEKIGSLLDTVLELTTSADTQEQKVKTISDVNVNKRGQRNKDLTTIIPITTGDIVYWVSLSSVVETAKPQFIKLIEAFQGFPFKTITVSNQTYYNIKGQLHSVAWTSRVIRSIYRYIKDQPASKILYLGNQTQSFFMTENQQKEDHVILDFQFVKGTPMAEPLFVSVINFAMSKYSPALALVFLQTFIVNMLYFANFNNEVRIFQYFLLNSENVYDLDLLQLYLNIRGFFRLDDVKNVQSLINKDVLQTNIDERTIDTKELVTATKLIFQNFTNERILTLVQIIMSACGKQQLSLIKVIPLLLMSYQNYKKVTYQVMDKLFKTQQISFADFKHFVQNNALPVSDDQIYEIFLCYACDNTQKTQYQINQFIELTINKEDIKQLISDYQLARFLVINKSMVSKSSTDQLLLDSYMQAYGSIKDGANRALGWLMHPQSKGDGKKAEKAKVSQKQLNHIQNLMNAMKTDLQILDYRQFAMDGLETSINLLKALFGSCRSFDACQVLHGIGQAFSIVEYGVFDEVAAAKALSAMSKTSPSPNESQLSGDHGEKVKEVSENNQATEELLKQEDLITNSTEDPQKQPTEDVGNQPQEQNTNKKVKQDQQNNEEQQE